MTSELRVDNLKGSTTGGSINVLSEGTSVTTNLQQGLCKVWINYNMISSTAERDSFNVSSLSDLGTGSTTVNINNDMANANYSGFFYCNAAAETAYNNFSNHYAGGWGGLTTGSFSQQSHDNTDVIDSFMNITGVMGDLA